MESGRPHPNYVKIWVWLLGLMAAGLVATLTPGGHAIGIIVIFATATAKALLVALNYMHLRFEPRLICVIALGPVVFALILAIALFPDFVFRR